MAEDRRKGKVDSATVTVPGISPADGRVGDELLVLHSPDPRWVGCCIPLDGRRIVIGRHPDGPYGLRFRDPCLSRNHAFFTPHPDSRYYVFEDTGSKNHSYVDGLLVTRRHLSPNAVVRIGHTVMLHRHVPADAGRIRRTSSSLEGDPLYRVVGASYAANALRGSILRVARSQLTVLVEGETGTGKELVAQVLHALSQRDGAFHAVNCSAVPPAMAESAFFGRSRLGSGSKPDADEPTPGHFRTAHRGTLYLDEIGELPLPVQPKLLRALDGAAITPVGGSEPTEVDVRIVASTNADLEEMTAEGTFRTDLHARLQEWPIHIPPLRDRPDDVIALTHHFLSELNSKLRLSADAAEAFVLHGWPYNVRELQKLIRRLCLLCDGDSIPLKVLPERMQQAIRDRQPGGARGSDVRPTEAELRAALEALGGNVSSVAQHFDRNRKQIYRWLAHFGIDMSLYRRG